MAHGVLHQRLEQELRHRRVQDCPIDLEGGHQAVGKPDRLDPQVLSNELELLAERHLKGAVRPHDPPQHVAQLLEHAAGRGGVPVAHDDGDGVQAVEQKMRLQLGPERGHSRFGELGLEPSRLGLALARLDEVAQRMLHAEHREIHGHPEGKRGEEPVVVAGAVGERPEQGVAQAAARQRPRGAERDRGREVERDPADQGAPHQRVAAAQDEHERREQPVDQPVAALEQDHARIGRPAARQAAGVLLEHRQRGGREPGRGDEQPGRAPSPVGHRPARRWVSR